MDENYVKDARGWKLSVGDRVNIPDPNVCNDDVRKIAEKYGNKWLYCGTVELHSGLCGGVIVPLGQERHDVVYVIADAHKQFYGLEIDREAHSERNKRPLHSSYAPPPCLRQSTHITGGGNDSD